MLVLYLMLDMHVARDRAQYGVSLADWKPACRVQGQNGEALASQRRPVHQHNPPADLPGEGAPPAKPT